MKNKSQQLARWKEHFNNLLNQDVHTDLDQLEIFLNPNDTAELIPNDEAPSENEIMKALYQQKKKQKSWRRPHNS